MCLRLTLPPFDDPQMELYAGRAVRQAPLLNLAGAASAAWKSAIAWSRTPERSCTGENARIHEASCQRPFAAREYDRETRKAGVGLWVRSTAV